MKKIPSLNVSQCVTLANRDFEVLERSRPFIFVTRVPKLLPDRAEIGFFEKVIFKPLAVQIRNETCSREKIDKMILVGA